MAIVTLDIPEYDPDRGVRAGTDGLGDLVVRTGADEIEIMGDPAGLRYLARWCLALAAPDAPDGSHVHLEPNMEMLTAESAPLVLSRQDPTT